MTFGSYFAVLVAVAVGLVGIDWWQLHTGRTVHYRLVSHRKLRAVGRLPGDIVATALGSVTPPLGAEPPQPAPGTPSTGVTPGAGAEPQAVTTADDPELSRRRPLPGGGLGPKTSVAAVVTPDSIAATGFQPQGDWGYAAASGPETGAAAGDVPMSQCIETRSVA